MKLFVFINRVKKILISDGNGDKTYLIWVESKIRKAIPFNFTSTIGNQHSIEKLKEVFSEEDVEKLTYSYLIPIFENILKEECK